MAIQRAKIILPRQTGDVQASFHFNRGSKKPWKTYEIYGKMFTRWIFCHSGSASGAAMKKKMFPYRDMVMRPFAARERENK